MDTEGMHSNLQPRQPQASRGNSPANLTFGEKKTHRGSARWSGSDVSCSSTRPFLCLHGTRTTSSLRSDTREGNRQMRSIISLSMANYTARAITSFIGGNKRLAVLHASGAWEISAPFLPGVIKSLGHICAAAYCKNSPPREGRLPLLFLALNTFTPCQHSGCTARHKN